VYHNLQVVNKRFDINLQVREVLLVVLIARSQCALKEPLAQFAQKELSHQRLID